MRCETFSAPRNKSTINEATVSGWGPILVQSGNWYLALSTNEGASWSFIDPFSLMSDVPGGFCCDQVVRYDPSRDMLLVLLMSVPSNAANGNALRLFVVRGLRSSVLAASAIAVFSYDFTPQALGLPVGQWHDYPKMTVGKNFLYMTTNRFSPPVCDSPPLPSCVFQGSTFYRISLDQLKAGTPLSFGFANLSEGSLLVAEGIGDSDTAYFVSNITTSTTRIGRLAESSGTIFFTDVPVATWSGAVPNCTGPDGRNFAGRADGRPTLAVISNRWDGVDGKQLLFGQISAAQPPSRPFAYTRITRVAVGSMTPIDTVDLAFSDACAIYASGSASSQGGVGLSAFSGGGSFHPAHIVCIKDEFGGFGPFPFQCANIRGSTDGPLSNQWGDYTYVDPLYPITCAYQTAGWVLIGGGANSNVDPHYASWGREKCFP